MEHSIIYHFISNKETIKKLIYLFKNDYYGADKLSDEKLKDLSYKYQKYAKIILALKDDLPVGYIAYYRNEYLNQKAYVSTIVVKSDYHRRGIGKQLLQKAIIDCQNYGFKSFELEVDNLNNSAITFYEKQGFIYDRAASRESSYFVLNLQGVK